MTDRAAEILSFTRRWAAALVANDADAIGSFMTADWIILGSDGPTLRGNFLASVASGDLTHDRMEYVSGPDIRFHGAVATVTGRIVNSGAFRGQPFAADEWTTDLLVRGPDGWLCALTHITAVRRPD